MKFWLGLRQGHWGCLPRVSSPTTASVGNCIRCCQYMGSISLLFWTDAALRCITAVFVCLFCFVSFPMHYVFSFLNLWLYWLVSLCLFTGPVGFLIQTVFYFLQVQWRDFSRWELSLFFFIVLSLGAPGRQSIWSQQAWVTLTLQLYKKLPVLTSEEQSRQSCHCWEQKPVIFWKHQVRSLLVIFILVISGIEKDVQNCSQ